MDLDSIQDIDKLKEFLKELMCKCIQEIELKSNVDGTVKTIIGHWYYFEYDDEDGIYEVYDGSGHFLVLEDFEFKKHFENKYIKKEGD